MSDNNFFTKDDLFVKLFDLKTPDKIIDNALSKEAKTFHSQILSTTDSFKKGKELESDLSQNYNVFFDEKYKSYSIMEKKIENDKNQNTAYFDKSFRNITYIDTFFNTLPNVVLGKLTPVLKIKFLFPKKDFNNVELSKDYLNRVPSLQNYVSSLEDKSGDLYNFNKSFIIDFNKKEDIDKLGLDDYTRRSLPRSGSYFITDESLYTSPPHLTSENNNFRPFMSISKMNVKFVPTIDFNISFDEYNLSLVIHDKTQLHKFSQLIGVESRTDITAIIEYGWSYSDGSDTDSDIYSYFFNKVLRKKAYCSLTNASYSFDDVGQVKIEMKLMTKGAEQLVVLDCLENANRNYFDAKHKLDELQKKFKGLLEIYNLSNIRDGVLIERITNDSVESLSEEQVKKINEVIKSLSTIKNKNNPNGSFFKTDLEKQGFIKNIENIRDELSVSKTGVNKQKQAYKDFISVLINNDFKKWVNSYRQNNKNLYSEFNKLTLNKVFLHEIFTYFISNPLLKVENDRLKGSIEEIQTIYYNFNENSPKEVKERSIGEFQIDIEHLNLVLQSKSNKKYTLEQFIGLILNEFLRKLISPGYGLGGTYEGLFSSSSDQRKSAEEKNKKQLEQSVKLREEQGFKITEPKISFRMENQQNIIRIHIYDANNRIIFKANKELVDSLDRVKSEFNNWKKEKITTDSVVTSIDNVFTQENKKIEKENKRFSYLKKIFQQSYPVLSFDGSGSTVIKSIQVSNNMDAATTTHLVLQSTDNKQNDSLMQKSYTRVVPGKITMESLGFPLAEVHQTFFIDMNTGTDIDNLYHITTVNHSIDPGSFKTSYELSTADNYGSHENIFTELEKIKKIVKGEIFEAASPEKTQTGAKLQKKT